MRPSVCVCHSLIKRSHIFVLFRKIWKRIVAHPLDETTTERARARYFHTAHDYAVNSMKSLSADSIMAGYIKTQFQLNSNEAQMNVFFTRFGSN